MARPLREWKGGGGIVRVGRERGDFWGNIYRKGEYTVSHDHFPSTFSIVYFLKGEKHFSPLVFNRFSKIRCKEGRLVIFPSYLKHWVPVHKHSETRITLSSNINLA